MRPLWKSFRAVRYRRATATREQIHFYATWLFFPCVSIFPTFPFDFFFHSTGRQGRGRRGGGAGGRLIVVRARWYSYRYNVIADTGGGGGYAAPPLTSPPRVAIYRFIFVVCVRAFPLRLAGCLQSNENLLGSQIFFRRRSVLFARAIRVSPFPSSPPPPPFTPPPLYNACGSISSGTYLYTVAPRYLARGPVRACMRACMTARARNY